jgi:tetratricopeptide (TPR) repeat protein
MSSFRLAFLLVAGLALAAPAARAVDALVKPVPTPDLSRLPAEQAKDLREARASFDKARATLAGDRLAQVYAMMGAAYASNGFPEAADVALEDASLLAPKDGRWVYARGVLAQSQKHEAVAQNYFDIAFGLDKEYLPIRLAVARARLANGDVAGARQLMTEYVASHDDQPAAHALLGEIALRQGNAANAVKHYRRALALDPADVMGQLRLADLLRAEGATGEAADRYREAVALDPSLAEAWGGLAAILAEGGPMAKHVDRCRSLAAGRLGSGAS